jgi:predicted aspartyl protease
MRRSGLSPAAGGGGGEDMTGLGRDWGRRDVLLLGLAQALSCALPTRALAQSLELAAPATIPATFSASNRMLIPVRIGGEGPFAFILDTAAESSVIAQDVAERLGLPSLGSAMLVSLTAAREVARVEARDVSYLPGASHTLRPLLLKGANIETAGILGIDALRGQRVVLDFEGNAMTVEPAQIRARPIGSDEIIVPGRRRLGQLILADCSIDGAPVDVIVDSGTQVSIGNYALRQQLITRRYALREITLLSVTGEKQPAEYTKADRLIIGNAEFVGMPIAFAEAYLFARLKLTRRPAMLLGMDALQMFARVALDFQNSEARFVFRNTSLVTRASAIR